MRYKVSISNMSKEQVMVYVDFILEGHNIAQAIKHFKSSRKYINDILNKVRLSEGEFYNEILAQKIKLTLDRLLLEARSSAGSKNHRENIISDREAINIVIKIVNTGVTLRALAKEYSCSRTTIANAIKRVADDNDLSAIVRSRTEKMDITSESEHFEKQIALLEDAAIIEAEDSRVLVEIRKIYKGRMR